MTRAGTPVTAKLADINLHVIANLDATQNLGQPTTTWFPKVGWRFPALYRSRPASPPEKA